MANHHNALVYRSKKRSAYDQGEEYGFLKKFKASTPEEQDDDGGLKGFVITQSVHSDSSEGSKRGSDRSEDTVVPKKAKYHDSGDDEESEDDDLPVFSVRSRSDKIMAYGGVDFSGNKANKALRLAEFFKKTGSRLDQYLAPELRPRYEDNSDYIDEPREEMEWNVELIDRLVDLVGYFKTKEEYNAALRAEVAKRNPNHICLQQIQKREVQRVLARVSGKNNLSEKGKSKRKRSKKAKKSKME